MSTTETASELGSKHAELETKLAELAELRKVPGAAVGLYRDGAEEYVFFGMTSIDNPLEVNSRALFQIGSTTKTSTGTVLSILADRGQVRLEAPVRQHLPELKLRDESVAEAVTVLHLLNHTAGWMGDIFDDTGDGDDALARYVELLSRVEQLQPLGGRASYNNAAVNLAGRVIEKVTGKTYETAVQDIILHPLGLHAACFFG